MISNSYSWWLQGKKRKIVAKVNVDWRWDEVEINELNYSTENVSDIEVEFISHPESRMIQIQIDSDEYQWNVSFDNNHVYVLYLILSISES